MEEINLDQKVWGAGGAVRRGTFKGIAIRRMMEMTKAKRKIQHISRVLTLLKDKNPK